MAPKKVKRLGKKTNPKIKSKNIPRKRPVKVMKMAKVSSFEEKPLNSIKWLKKVKAEGVMQDRNPGPGLLSDLYQHDRLDRSPSPQIEQCDQMEEVEIDSASSKESEECQCSHTKYSDSLKYGKPRRRTPSSDSVVAKYIKSGMSHVASFIVESAIRFGEEHGVVIPDKRSPNVFEVMSARGNSVNRRIRFKIPDKVLGYEDAKKVMWRSQNKNAMPQRKRSRTPEDYFTREISKESSYNTDNNNDSLDDILPLLDKLESAGDVISSDLDLMKLKKQVDEHKNKRLREKYRNRENRYRDPIEFSNEEDEGEHLYKGSSINMYRKFRKDSVELGRKRLKGLGQRKSFSPSL